MKHAYVSVVLPTTSSTPTEEALQSLDQALRRSSRNHEIIVVSPYSDRLSPPGHTWATGPLTVLQVYPTATRDSAVIAGLARAAGDFIIEWHGPIQNLDATTLTSLLQPTDTGIELVEIEGSETSVISKTFYRVANALRPPSTPIHKSIGRVYSRRALGHVLLATTFEPQIAALVSELPVTRSTHRVDCGQPEPPSTRRRISEGFMLLAKGTRIGSTVPILLAFASALFGLGAAIYAISILLVRGRTPEGWTTLMVVTGLGQAAILAMLGLTWTRIDSLGRGLSRRSDATCAVTVWAPTSDNRDLEARGKTAS